MAGEVQPRTPPLTPEQANLVPTPEQLGAQSVEAQRRQNILIGSVEAEEQRRANFLERAHSVGASSINFYHTKRRKVLAILATAAAGVAIGSTTELAFAAQPAGAENIPARLADSEVGLSPAASIHSAIEARQTSGKTLHRNSNLTTQGLLDEMRHIVMPCAPFGGCVKGVPTTRMGDIHPTSAFATPSSAGFRDGTCNHTIPKPLYALWAVYTSGTSYITCLQGGLPAKLPHSTPNEYQKQLNQLGNRVERSVRLHFNEPTKKASGNRHAVTVWYDCNSAPSTGSSANNTKAGISKITLTQAFRNRNGHGRQYSRVRISNCAWPRSMTRQEH